MKITRKFIKNLRRRKEPACDGGVRAALDWLDNHAGDEINLTPQVLVDAYNAAPAYAGYDNDYRLTQGDIRWFVETVRLPKEFHLELLRIAPYDVQRVCVSRVPFSDAYPLVKDDPHLLEVLCCDNTIPRKLHEELCKHENWLVRWYVSQDNPTLKTLRLLCEDESPSIRNDAELELGRRLEDRS